MELLVAAASRNSLLWEGTGVWGAVLLLNLFVALVLLVAFARTRRLTFRNASIGLGLQAVGIFIYLSLGWPIVATIIAIAGACILLASGLIRPSC